MSTYNKLSLNLVSIINLTLEQGQLSAPLGWNRARNSEVKDKKLNWLLTQMSHLPGNHLSGTLVAYMIAPAMYKTPIRAIQPTEAWRWASATPCAAMKWIAGTIPEHPNVRNKPDGKRHAWINCWIYSGMLYMYKVLAYNCAILGLQCTFSMFQLFKRKGLS